MIDWGLSIQSNSNSHDKNHDFYQFSQWQHSYEEEQNYVCVLLNIDAHDFWVCSLLYY